MRFDQTCLNIDLDALRHNFDLVRQKVGGKVMAVIKADAYGLGAVAVARALEDRCAFFGVANIAEALELRNAGIHTPILILGRVPVSAYPMAIREDIRTSIFIYEDAVALSEEASRQGKTALFHFAVDTGMSRIGLQATEENADLCVKIASLPNLQAEGLFSHFAGADCADLTGARQQAELFATFDAMLKARGLSIPIRHMNNSAGIMNFDTGYEMVRSGIITYGMYPSDEVDPGLLKIQPALQWLSRVTHVKTLPAGREISYGGTYVTTKETRVATVPVGYADGYRRCLSGNFYVLIRGKKAPILGRVCMDQMMVDVTDIPDVTLNDRVVLVGKSGDEEITMEQLAAAMDTINYEVVCGISRRVPRVYCRRGKTVHSVHYLLDT